MENDQTDELLIRKYLELGDVRSLETLIDRYLPKALLLFTRLTQRTADAQDLTQSVFLAILRRLDKGAPITNFAAFFAVCSRNAFRDYLRQKRTRRRMVELQDDAVVQKIALIALRQWQFQQSEVTFNQLDAAINRCLQDYEDERVRAILADHLAGLAWKEIAEKHNCSANYAATLWHRKKHQLLAAILREIGL